MYLEHTYVNTQLEKTQYLYLKSYNTQRMIHGMSWPLDVFNVESVLTHTNPASLQHRT